MELKYDCVEYLKDQPQPWVQYQWNKIFNSENDDLIKQSKELLLKSKEVQDTFKLIEDWPEPPLVRHNDVHHSIHKIHLLLDMGVDESDPFIQKIIQKILDNQNENGAFLSLLHVPEAYGGAKEPAMGWLMCDFPILLHFLIKTGQGEDERVKKAINYLKVISQDNGWRCMGSVEKFRGPGRKLDHCPVGTLWALQAFSLLPSTHKEDYVKRAVDAICEHWIHTKERKIYMFAMGTNFRKLKYPNHWYDIFHVIQVLSCFEYAREKDAFSEMIDVVYNKQCPDGAFIPESIYTGYKGWDFGQKKNASPTLTLAIWKIFNKINL